MRAARVAVYVLGGLLAGLVLLVVALIVVSEFWPEIVTGAPPKIARGIDFIFRDDAGAHAFNGRVRKLFPAGTNEKELKEKLGAQGFSPGWPGSQCDRHEDECREIRQMYYVWGMFPCSNELFVTWTMGRKNTVEKVSGSYQYVCV